MPEPKKRGRPRRPDPTVSVTTWLPSQDYDRLYRRAQREEKSISALVRELVERRLKSTLFNR